MNVTGIQIAALSQVICSRGHCLSSMAIVLDQKTVTVGGERQMSKLTDKVINCGLCDCEHKTTSITYLEAQQCIDVVKQACIDAVSGVDRKNSEYPAKILRFDAIQAIRDVK